MSGGYEEWCRNLDSQRDNIIKLAYENDPITRGKMAEYVVGPTPGLFGYFKSGDPDRVDRMLEYLSEAKYVLGKDLREHLGGAQLAMDGWTGSAAVDFREWLLKLEDAINLLSECVDMLIVILRAYKALVLGTRNDVLNLVDKTLQGIEAAEVDGWKIVLAAVGAVAGVVGAVVSGGATLALTAAVVTSMVSGAAGVASEMIDADSELEVIDQMNKAASSMVDKIRAEADRLNDGLTTLSSFVSGAKLAEVRPGRPEVITAPSFDPGSFGLPDEMQGGHKRPTDTTDLVPEPERHEDGPFDKSVFGGDQYEEEGPA